MSHTVTVEPSKNKGMGESFRAECSCGWASKWRATRDAAWGLGAEHVAEHPRRSAGTVEWLRSLARG